MTEPTAAQSAAWQDKVATFFRLPIQYVEHQTLPPSVVQDLELVQLVSPEDTTAGRALYSTVACGENALSAVTQTQLAPLYTSNKAFLEDTQKLLQRYPQQTPPSAQPARNYDDVLATWQEVRTKHGFKEKYFYVEWERLDSFNYNSQFLQALSTYNLLSPVLTLLLPIIILLIPFAILHIRGLAINFTEYVQVLKVVASNNAVGKLFVTNFAAIGTKDKLYIVSSALFYLFSIYQNFMVAKRYYTNLHNIVGHLRVLHQFAQSTLARLQRFELGAQGLATYQEFLATAKTRKAFLELLVQRLEPLCALRNSFEGLGSMGDLLQIWYELHAWDMWEDMVVYSLGLHGYLDTLEGLQTNVRAGHLAFAKLHTYLLSNKKREDKKTPDKKHKKDKNKKNKNKKLQMKQAYYPMLLGQQPVRNTLRLDKHLILTGPNASGKTTVLKTMVTNALLTQQWGCGCYGPGTELPLFQHIHCYLNIPDTSGRDSLFQAEARRCKSILDSVAAHPEDLHLCVFDELYSGTNPEEADASSTAFMRYLGAQPTVRSVLTTHFVNVCKELRKDPSTMRTCQMLTRQVNDRPDALEYTYHLAPGISTVKGGVHILRQLAYPTSIVQDSFKEMKKKVRSE